MVTKDTNHHQTGQNLDIGRNKTAATTVAKNKTSLSWIALLQQSWFADGIAVPCCLLLSSRKTSDFCATSVDNKWRANNITWSVSSPLSLNRTKTGPDKEDQDWHNKEERIKGERKKQD